MGLATDIKVLLGTCIATEHEGNRMAGAAMRLKIKFTRRSDDFQRPTFFLCLKIGPMRKFSQRSCSESTEAVNFEF